MQIIDHKLNKDKISIDNCDCANFRNWYYENKRWIKKHILDKIFVGYVEFNTIILDQEVPDILKDNYIVTFDENENEIKKRKTFSEYFKVVWSSKKEGKSIAQVCHRDINYGTVKRLHNYTLWAWCDYFGIDNIYTYECFKNITKIEIDENV